MADSRWKERLNPVQDDVIVLLSGLVGGDLFDKLLAKEVLTDDQYNDLDKAKETKTDKKVASDLVKLLKKKAEPAYEKFCKVLQAVDGGKDVLALLKLETSSVDEGKKEDSDFSKTFRTISSKISPYWFWIARCIPPKAFDDSEIEAIKRNHRDNVREQAYQMLTEWKQKWGSEASPKNLCKALLDEGKRATAVELFGSKMVTDCRDNP